MKWKRKKKDDFIKAVGYNQEWFEFGFLTEDFLAMQKAVYETGENLDPKHFKWTAYGFVLRNEKFEDPDRLRQFVEVMKNDPDEHLYIRAVVNLIRKKIITKERFETLWNSVLGPGENPFCT